MAAQISWNELKPFSNDPILHTGLRFEKIKVKTLKNTTNKSFLGKKFKFKFRLPYKALLTVNLKSKCFDEKKDAIKVK